MSNTVQDLLNQLRQRAKELALMNELGLPTTATPQPAPTPKPQEMDDEQAAQNTED